MSTVSSVGQTPELSAYTAGGRIDPYSVFQLNFEALGGEKNVKHDTTFRFKGEIKLGDVTFDYQEAIKKPLMSMKAIISNYKIIYQSGDDGKTMWSSQGGNVDKLDKSDSPQREIDKLMAEFAYTDPKNRTFNVTADRKVNIDGSSCFEVKIRNRKTDEVVTQYYDERTYLLKREIKQSSDEHIQTDFSDYKQVGKIKMAFKKEVLYPDTDTRQIITWKSIEKGCYIADSVFSPPAEKIRPGDLSNFTGTGAKVDTYA